MVILICDIGQVIAIGDAVTVAMLGVSGNPAKIGIEAPKEMPIDQEEIAMRNQPSWD
jgi:carbon storage regulator CsrA